MGVRYGNVCYTDLNAAQQGFLADFPQVQGNNVVTVTSVTNSSPFTITFTPVYTTLNTNPATVTTYNARSISLSSCSLYTSGLDSIPLQLIFFVVALFFAVIFGFRSGYRP